MQIMAPAIYWVPPPHHALACMRSLYFINFLGVIIPSSYERRQQSRAPRSGRPGGDRAGGATALGPDLKPLTAGQPLRRERGRTSPRSGARRDRRREPSCARPSGGGHCRPRANPAPASASGARGPPLRRAPLPSRSGPSHYPRPGPGALTSLLPARRPGKPDRAARVLRGHPPSGRCAGPGRLCAPPSARSHSHLHLGTERLQAPGLPGWAWPPPLWVRALDLGI